MRDADMAPAAPGTAPESVAAQSCVNRSPLALRAFQRRFIRAATSPGIDTAAFSLPRGNGKSWLAGHLVARILDPADPLFRPGTESVLCAASIEQARIVFRFARAELGELEYRYIDSATRCAILHKPTRTRLRVIGSNGLTAMGLVGCPWAVCDEPGAWMVNGGTLLHDAIEGAKGKPGSPLRSLYIGTLAPATAGWWHDMVQGGTHGSTVVHALQGDPETWDRWPTIRKANPLTAISADFRAKLLEERDAARRDPRLKARFMSYRLNVPSGDESTMLLTVDDWRRVLARPVPDRDGAPIVGLDLGGGRAWSAAIAVWPSGRVEAIAVAPGIPDLDAQEKRDRAPAGTYRKPRRRRRSARRRGFAGATARRDVPRGGRCVGRSPAHHLRSLPPGGAPGRGQRRVPGVPAPRPVVGGERGYPRGAQVRGRWSALVRSRVEGAAHGIARGGDGEVR